MTALVVVAGAAIVVVTLVDLVWTTVAAGSGAGPITRWQTSRLWRLALVVHRHRPSHTVLTAAGVAIVVSVLATWVALVLAGWSVVFSAADGAVRDTTAYQPADLVARVYFVGYSAFTLGNGDYAPGDGVWQLATVLATGTGLVVITLSITYLVPVASAAATRRQLAASIASLGSSPREILATSWDGSGFDGLALHLRSLTTLLEASRQQHLTYPVLHYLHSTDVTSAAAPNVTNLAQALHLLRYDVAASVRPAPALLVPLERTLDSFLATLRGAHIGPGEPVPLPARDVVAAAGIPATDAAAGDGERATRERRALLGGWLAGDGWSRGDHAG